MKLSKWIFRILKLKFSKKNCYVNEIFEKHKTLTFLSGKIFTLKIMVTNRLQFKLQTFSTFEIIFYIPRMYYLSLLSTSYFYRFPLVFADFEYQMNAYIRHKIAVFSHYLWFVSLQMVKTENTLIKNNDGQLYLIFKNFNAMTIFEKIFENLFEMTLKFIFENFNSKIS